MRAVLSCIINANEMRSRSGVDSCTSNLCVWNHAVHEVCGKTILGLFIYLKYVC